MIKKGRPVLGFLAALSLLVVCIRSVPQHGPCEGASWVLASRAATETHDVALEPSDSQPPAKVEFEPWQIGDLFQQMMAGTAFEYGDPIEELLQFAVDNMSRPGESRSFTVYMLNSEIRLGPGPSPKSQLTLYVGLRNHDATAQRVEARLSFEVDGHEIYGTNVVAENVGPSGTILSVQLEFDSANPIHRQLRNTDLLKPVFRVRRVVTDACA